jgi:membrane-associated protein
MLESLADVVSGSPLTYPVVALLVAGDAIVPVFPGESAVVAAAVLAAEGELMVWLILLAAFGGAFLGDLLMYGLGRWRARA